MPELSTNRWDLLVPPETGRWSPRLRASIIIPYYESLGSLRMTLIGLRAQTYPAELTSVVLVDDGSSTPLSGGDIGDLLDADIITLPDEGFRLAKARNAGGRSADGDVLVFLDHDMIPDPEWLESHMRWHHAANSALVLGFRDHVDDGWLDEEVVRRATDTGGLGSVVTSQVVERPEWIEFHMTRTKDLTSADSDLFRVVTGGNMSIATDFFRTLTGFDETFTRWGGEDTEFGYRAWISGALLIPERGAHCWHQGLGTIPDTTEKQAQNLQARKLAHLIPHPAMRKASPGRQWQRPLITVQVGPGTPGEIAGTATALLAISDLEIWISQDKSPELSEDFGPDSRVHLENSPEDDSPYTPLRCHVPAGLAPEPTLIEKMAERALATGKSTSADGIEMVSVRHLATGNLSDTFIAESSARVQRPSAVSRVLDRASRVRSWSDVRSASRWLSAAAKRRSVRSNVGVPAPPRALDVNLWSRVLAPDFPTLPATGSTSGRVDLVVRAANTAPVEGVAEVVADVLPDRELLTYPPINATDALAVLQGRRSPTTPLALMLSGMPPDEAPPGPRTQRAWRLLSDSVDEAGLEAARRAVLSEHLEAVRLDQLRIQAGLSPALPLVSIVMSTRRAERAPDVIVQMCDQTYPYLELIVVAHGVEDTHISEQLATARVDHEVIEVETEVPFGAALARGSRRAAGELIAKVDDDDLYARTHIEDLVLAWLLSRADVVGKAAEFVWLERPGTALHRFRGGSYTHSRTLAGGAIAVTRASYERIGGWRPVNRHVDQALIEDVISAGGTTFRTHGLGYVLVRHGDHTWDTNDQRFLDQAETTWDEIPGWILESPLERR